MIGLVLVTHGRLAQEFIAAMEHMVGPQTHLRAICIGPEDDIERRQREIAAAAKSVDMAWSSPPTCSAARPATWH
jgi:PTS system mannose-specific IIA component